MCKTLKNDVTKRQKIRLSTILEDCWSDYVKSSSRKLYLEDAHHKAVRHILACRTEKLGHQLFACESCGDTKLLYRSCKHRFCPRCGVVETAIWAEKLMGKILNMAHHHVVFTLPKILRSLCKRNKQVLYNLLFRSSASSLQDWFSYKYGLKCGIVSVLHSAGSDLKYHPHVHLIVTGGGIDSVGNLEGFSGKYLMNHKHLSRMYRWRFCKGLVAAFEGGELDLSVTEEHRKYILSLVARLNRQRWIVSIQPSLSDASSIVKYVGRYTKRACISEYKIVSYENKHITFKYNDYKNSKRGDKPKVGTIRLHYVAFLDRLLTHLPEKGFRMVRYYGLYSNSNIKQLPKEHLLPASSVLDQALIKDQLASMEGDFQEFRSSMLRLTGKDQRLFHSSKLLIKTRSLATFLIPEIIDL